MRNRIAALVAASMLIATPGLPGMITAFAKITYSDTTNYGEESIELSVGETKEIEFVITSTSDAPSKETKITAEGATCESSNESVATAKFQKKTDGGVNSKLVITAVSSGEAKITISKVLAAETTSDIDIYEGATKTITVTVKAAESKSDGSAESGSDGSTESGSDGSTKGGSDGSTKGGSDGSTDSGSSDSGKSDGSADSGSSDSGKSDGSTDSSKSDGSTDSGSTDSGSTDSGSSDSGKSDGSTDSGSSDSGKSDGSTDSGSSDSGKSDGSTDSGSSDSSKSDGSTDSGSTDSGKSDGGGAMTDEEVEKAIDDAITSGSDGAQEALAEDIASKDDNQAVSELKEVVDKAESTVSSTTATAAEKQTAVKNAAGVTSKVAEKSESAAVVNAAISETAGLVDALLDSGFGDAADEAVSDALAAALDAMADVAKAAIENTSVDVKTEATQAVAGKTVDVLKFAKDNEMGSAAYDALVQNAIDNVVDTLKAASINTQDEITDALADSFTDMEGYMQEAGYGGLDDSIDQEEFGGFSIPYGAALNLGGKKGTVKIQSWSGTSGTRGTSYDGQSFNMNSTKRFSIDLVPAGESSVTGQLTIPMKVQLPLDYLDGVSGLSLSNTLRVVHFDHNGNPFDYIEPTWDTGTGRITFYTTSLSDFAFANVTETPSRNTVVTINRHSSGSGSSGGSSSGSGSVTGTSAAASGSSTTSNPATPGSWTQREDGAWVFLKEDGTPWQETWIVYGQQWYFVNDQGVCQTGWQILNGVYYYFSAQTVEGQPLGSLYMNKTTPDGYTVDANGAWVQR